MKWKDVAGLLPKGLDLIGKVIGGPAGIAAQAAGDLVAGALGVESKPDAVAAALTSNPDAIFKLQELQLNAQVQLQSLATQQDVAEIQADLEAIKAVNETMQVEANSEHWMQWSWRPFIGFCFGLAFFFVALLVCWLAYEAVIVGKLEAMTMIPQLVSAITILFGVPGTILGVSAWHRGRAKIEEVKASAAGG